MYGSVLIVDPDRASCELLREALTYDGFIVDVVAGPQGVQTSDSYDVVVADVDLEGLLTLQERTPGSHLVLLASPDRADEATTALHLGAFDVVMRPFYVEDVSLTVACAAAQRRGRVPTNPLHLLLKNCEVTR